MMITMFTQLAMGGASIRYFSSKDIIIIIINNLFKVGVLNERLIATKKLIKANYL